MTNENSIIMKKKIKHQILALFRLRSRSGRLSLLKRFSYKDIKKATDGFKRVTDSSSQGASYKAKFHNGSGATVKEIKLAYEDDDAFCREVQLLGRIHHRHIVELCGFSTGTKRFLVYEDMENGSLKEHLSDPLKTPLNWRTRLQIAIGIAAALEYLLFFCDPPVQHISLSSSNIMLDENLIAKISDVGLHYAPENYITLPAPSEGQECKSIIFQLGVLILELVTGQSSDKGSVDLVKWVQEVHLSKSIHRMIDPDLGDSYDTRELNGLLNVAKMCIRSVDKSTTFTPQILWFLQKKIGVALK